MQIADVLFAPGQGAFYNDDQAAVRTTGRPDGHFIRGRPQTSGFSEIRVPAAALSIGLILESGEIHWGDMTTVQYAGTGGREPPLDVATLEKGLREDLLPALAGLRIEGFRETVSRLERRLAKETRLPMSARYGLSQALLSATASVAGRTMAEVVTEEYGFPLAARPVPILCQSGEDRRNNVDKMILRRADVLPHGLINSPHLIGNEGASLCDYVAWVRDRVLQHGASNYHPHLHFDVYGGIGQVFDLDLQRMVSFLSRLETLAEPLALRIESPADFGSRQAQITGLAEIRHGLKGRGSMVQIVADEWCNTVADVEAFVANHSADLIQLKMPDMGSIDDTVRGIQVCRDGDVGVYLGGSCTETDVSARVSVHVAVAAQVDMMLAKPGMGVDEGYTIVANEQARLLAVLESRAETRRAGEGAESISVLGRA